MIDSDLAELYTVSTKRLNEQVKRNIRRFPKDFMFQLSENEKKEMLLEIEQIKKHLSQQDDRMLSTKEISNTSGTISYFIRRSRFASPSGSLRLIGFNASLPLKTKDLVI